MNKNESDSLLELERLCRIIVYQTVKENELDFWRKTLKTGFEKIAKIRQAEANRKQELKEKSKEKN